LGTLTASYACLNFNFTVTLARIILTVLPLDPSPNKSWSGARMASFSICLVRRRLDVIAAPGQLLCECPDQTSTNKRD
jgi:hypothetical protein